MRKISVSPKLVKQLSKLSLLSASNSKPTLELHDLPDEDGQLFSDDSDSPLLSQKDSEKRSAKFVKRVKRLCARNSLKPMLDIFDAVDFTFAEDSDSPMDSPRSSEKRSGKLVKRVKRGRARKTSKQMINLLDAVENASSEDSDSELGLSPRRRVTFRDDGGGELAEVHHVEHIQKDRGNMLAKCWQFLIVLECGDRATRILATRSLRGVTLGMATDRFGAVVLVRALETAKHDGEILELIRVVAYELEGHCRELFESPHGCSVLLASLKALPVYASAFIARELLPVVSHVAQHEFGHLVLLQVFELMPPVLTAPLWEVLHEDHDYLSCNDYAGDVFQLFMKGRQASECTRMRLNVVGRSVAAAR